MAGAGSGRVSWDRIRPWSLGLTAFLSAVFAGHVRAEPDSQSQRLENWIDYQQTTPTSGQWEYDPRLFIAVTGAGGWTFTQRIDVPFYETNAAGPRNPSGAWTLGLADAFVEEIVTTPELARGLRLTASARVVFPTGGAAPFGSNQWQWAPSVGLAFRAPVAGENVLFEPLARYFGGFDVQHGAQRVQSLTLYPTATVKLGKRWSLVAFPQNPVVYNAATQKWFVPIDGMLVYSVNKTLNLGFGGAWPLVADDPASSYRYALDVRLFTRF